MTNIDNTWYQRAFKDFEATLLPWSTDKCIGIIDFPQKTPVVS